MKKDSDLLNIITEMAREFPESLLNSLCNELELLNSEINQCDINAFIGKIPQFQNRDLVSSLFRIWKSQNEDLSPEAISIALKSAYLADDYQRKNQQLEIVWTGPSEINTSFRRTDQALLELINSSTKKLLIVTFVAYRMEEIKEALLAASKRGVEITFILESPDISENKIYLDTIKSIGKKLAESSKVYIWPLERRLKDHNGKHGSLHAKCAVADENMSFISSANLTNYALNLNMEMGILIKSKDIAKSITDHFESLALNGVLKLF